MAQGKENHGRESAGSTRQQKGFWGWLVRGKTHPDFFFYLKIKVYF